MLSIKQQYITELKRLVSYEMKTAKRSGIYGFIQRTMAYNSNRIEGSTLTERQTASMFETGTISNEEDILMRTKDVEEMSGHFRMFNQTIQTLDEPLSIDIIKQMHYNLKVGVFEDMANGYPCGEFKNRANRVSDIVTSEPQNVEKDITALLNKYLQVSTPSVKDLAAFHAEYENIHPFQDGNGRTGRMILFRESVKHNMIPIIIRSENKDRYMQYLNQAQTNKNLRNLTEYFEQEQSRFFEETKNMVLPYEILERDRQRKQAGDFSDKIAAPNTNDGLDGPR